MLTLTLTSLLGDKLTATSCFMKFLAYVRFTYIFTVISFTSTNFAVAVVLLLCSDVLAVVVFLRITHLSCH